VKPVLFRIFVLVSGALVLFAQTESLAARGGGGRGGGGRGAGSSSRSSVSVGGYRAGEGQNRKEGSPMLRTKLATATPGESSRS
jgi:uncharacterized membrane protein